MALPENEIDVGFVALNLAREFYPDLKVATYSKKIDRLARRVRKLVGGSDDPEKRIWAINTVLFQQEGYDYDLEALAEDRSDPSFLSRLLDTKLGNCFSLPILYMAIAQRLGYPVYPVSAPSHAFLRYVRPDLIYTNIEATSYGDFYRNEAYIESFSLGEKALQAGSYLRTLSYREFLGIMLSKNAHVYSKNGQTEKAVAYLEKALALDPLSPDVIHTLAQNHAAMSVFSNGTDAVSHRDKFKEYDKRATELGFVGLTETAVWQKVRQELRL